MSERPRPEAELEAAQLVAVVADRVAVEVTAIDSPEAVVDLSLQHQLRLPRLCLLPLRHRIS